MGSEHDVVHGLNGLRQIAPDLDQLAEATEAPASMFSASVEAFLRPRPQLRSAAITVRRRGRLVGAVPVALRRTRMGSQIVKAGVPGEPFRLLAADPKASDALADAMIGAFGHLDRGWRVHLSDLPTDDPTAEAVLRRSRHGYRHLAGLSPTLWVGGGSDLNTVLSRNVRNARNKAMNKIAKDGRSLNLTWVTDPGRIAEALPTVIDLHIRRNDQLRHQALLDLDSERNTFSEVLLTHARAGRVRLLEARIDDQLAAFAACLVSGRRLWAYANYAHPDWLEFSPGTIANAEVVRAGFEDPTIDIVDWGQGVQRYKMSGGAVLVPSQELYAWRHRHMAVLWQARHARYARSREAEATLTMATA